MNTQSRLDKVLLNIPLMQHHASFEKLQATPTLHILTVE